jgi:hypothetical protein
MQGNLDMGHDKASQINAVPDHRALLEAARLQALRTSSTQDLKRLILSLETACETARVAAISALQDGAKPSGEDAKTDHTCGFAELFAALRHTRAALVGRNTGRPKCGVSTSSSSRAAQVVSPPPAQLSAAILTQQKAQR